MKQDLYFKEDTPLHTVNRIKQVLDRLNITVEEEWMVNHDKIYSLSLKSVNYPFLSNGKGSTEDYAKASAYAEFIERLNSELFFRMFDNYNMIYGLSKINTDLKEYYGFNEYCKVLLNSHKSCNAEAFYKSVSDVLLTKVCTKVCLINKDSYKKLELPSLILDIFYGSNGMASGNTLCEAKNQAIFEIFERYAICELFRDNINIFSDITDYCKLKYETIRELLSLFESNRLVLKIIDLSIDLDLPVILVIAIDVQEKKYLSAFASHINLRVCVERALNEILQGRKIKTLKYQMNNLSDIHNCIDINNINKFFVDNSGSLPLKLLDFNKMDNEVGIIWNDDIRTNDKILKFCEDKIYNLGFEIYYNIWNNLDFPTIQVIVPGMSEIVKDDYNELLASYLIEHEFKSIFSNPDLIKRNSKKILDHFENINISDGCTLGDLFNIPLNNDSSYLDALNFNLLLSICALYISDFDRAYIYIKRFYFYIVANCEEESIVEYYEIIYYFINFRRLFNSHEKILSILSTYFDVSTLLQIENDLRNENLFCNIGYIPCITKYTCDDCTLTNSCQIRELFILNSSMRNNRTV